MRQHTRGILFASAVVVLLVAAFCLGMHAAGAGVAEREFAVPVLSGR